ncbi:MAG: hypothetical protein AAF533_07355 [Acidobacteriota bacterium]
MVKKGKNLFRWLCLGVVSVHGLSDWMGLGGSFEPNTLKGPNVVTARPAPVRSSGGGHGAYYSSGYRGGK